MYNLIYLPEASLVINGSSTTKCFTYPTFTTIEEAKEFIEQTRFYTISSINNKHFGKVFCSTQCFNLREPDIPKHLIEIIEGVK